MTENTRPIVTAVGAMLQPKGNEPRVRRQIRRGADGVLRVVDLPLRKPEAA